jgi:hypothetical protein
MLEQRRPDLGVAADDEPSKVFSQLGILRGNYGDAVLFFSATNDQEVMRHRRKAGMHDLVVH